MRERASAGRRTTRRRSLRSTRTRTTTVPFLSSLLLLWSSALSSLSRVSLFASSQQRSFFRRTAHAGNEEEEERLLAHRVRRSIDCVVRRHAYYSHPPRDAVEGFARAVQSVAKGSLGSPMTVESCVLPNLEDEDEDDDDDGGSFRGLVSASDRAPAVIRDVKSLGLRILLNFVSSLPIFVVGVLSGLRQLVFGVVNSYQAVFRRRRGERYDPYSRAWGHYRLDSDLLAVTMETRRYRDDADRFYYDVLDVDPTSTLGQIKLAYRNMARRLHPDRNPGHLNSMEASEQFRLLAEAYETLSDDRKRRLYDTGNLLLGDGDNGNDASTTLPNALEFAPVFLNLRPELEHYVGDLRAAAFLDRMLRADGADERETRRRYDSLQRRREIHVAMHLQRRLRELTTPPPTNDGDDDLRTRCDREARALLGDDDDDDVAARIVETLGRAVVMEARVFLNGDFPNPVPWTRKKTHQIASALDVSARFARTVGSSALPAYRAYRETRRHQEDDDDDDDGGATTARGRTTRERTSSSTRGGGGGGGAIEFLNDEDKRVIELALGGGDDDDDGDDDDRSRRRVRDRLLPRWIDLSWRIVLWDVSRTAQQAVHKLLHDTTSGGANDPKKGWRERARAASTLGEAFVDAATERRRAIQRRADADANADADADVRDLLDRFDVALNVAREQKKGLAVTNAERARIEKRVRSRNDAVRKKRRKRRTRRRTSRTRAATEN